MLNERQMETLTLTTKITLRYQLKRRTRANLLAKKNM